MWETRLSSPKIKTIQEGIILTLKIKKNNSEKLSYISGRNLKSLKNNFFFTFPTFQDACISTGKTNINKKKISYTFR